LAKSNPRDSLKLTSIDDLFSTEESRIDSQREKVLEIPLSEISDFPNHPFKVKADEAMLEMADSVKQYGVLVPGLVRPKADGGYEMVAGHRRKKASELAGRETMPCIVRNLDDDEATIIMVDSNLQRENILPSEKAFAYKMKLEAMNRQGQRTDLTFSQLGKKLNSYEELADKSGESRNQIYRYIRLTELIPSILEMVDDKRIAFNPAVEISYLTENEQQDLYKTMQSEDCTVWC
jgi:ParB family chromosome partitioning protein